MYQNIIICLTMLLNGKYFQKCVISIKIINNLYCAYFIIEIIDSIHIIKSIKIVLNQYILILNMYLI